jgi:hypothetical protein
MLVTAGVASPRDVQAAAALRYLDALAGWC